VSREGWTRLAIALAAVAALEALCRAGTINRLTMIAPSEMALAMFGLLARANTWDALLWTCANVAAAVALSVGVGLAIAFVLHRRDRIRRAIDPFLASYYAVPFFVLYPILVSILGLNRWPLIMMGFIFAMPAMITAMLNGLDAVPRFVFKIGRLYRMSRFRTITQLVLPATAPALFTGIKLCVAYSFIGIIAGEFILADRGLGFGISDAYNRFDGKTMYGLMLLTLTIVIVVNALVLSAEQRVRRRWQRAS
jgi:NitT/TauT family transport system permease protein